MQGFLKTYLSFMQARSFVELVFLHIPNSCWLLLWRRPQETCLEKCWRCSKCRHPLWPWSEMAHAEKDRCASEALVSSCTCVNWNDSWTFHGCLTLFAISALSDSVCIKSLLTSWKDKHIYMCVCVQEPVVSEEVALIVESVLGVLLRTILEIANRPQQAGPTLRPQVQDVTVREASFTKSKDERILKSETC